MGMVMRNLVETIYCDRCNAETDKQYPILMDFSSKTREVELRLPAEYRAYHHPGKQLDLCERCAKDIGDYLSQCNKHLSCTCECKCLGCGND